MPFALWSCRDAPHQVSGGAKRDTGVAAVGCEPLFGLLRGWLLRREPDGGFAGLPDLSAARQMRADGLPSRCRGDRGGLSTRLPASGMRETMLHHLLHRCLLAIAAMFLASAAWSCPHGADMQQHAREMHAEDAAGASTSNVSPDTAASDTTRGSASTGPGAVVLPAVEMDLLQPHRHQAATGPVRDHRACCETGECDHAGSCAGRCCASAPALLNSYGPRERKVIVLVPYRPMEAFGGGFWRSALGDGDQDRRRRRDAEAVRLTLHEPRLARVARLTI